MNPEDQAFEEFLEKSARMSDMRRMMRQDVMPAAMKSMYWLRRLGNLGHMGYKVLNAQPQMEFQPAEQGETPRMNPYFSSWVQ
jgi:hypothetical protein